MKCPSSVTFDSRETDKDKEEQDSISARSSHRVPQD